MEKKDNEKFVTAMQEKLIDNICDEIAASEAKSSSRIKVDWIIPEALGLKGNRLDSTNKQEVGPAEKRKYFVELCKFLSKKCDISVNKVISTFFGDKGSDIPQLKKQLTEMSKPGSKVKAFKLHLKKAKARKIQLQSPFPKTTGGSRASSPGDPRFKPKISGVIQKKAPSRKRSRP